MTTLDEALQEAYGTDTHELAEKYKDYIGSEMMDEHEKTISVLATTIVISYAHGDACGWIGAAQALFAAGYEAGRNAGADHEKT